MGVKDADTFIALADLADELIVRRLAVQDGAFAVAVDAEGYDPEKVELTGADLEAVRCVLLRVIDRERAEVDARLKDQGVELGGTITVSKDGEVTLPDEDPPER